MHNTSAVMQLWGIWNSELNVIEQR
jgi:hypothetical protein